MPPFEFDPDDPDQVALLARSAAREREGQTVPEVLTEIAKLVFEWVPWVSPRKVATTCKVSLTNAHGGYIFCTPTGDVSVIEAEGNFRPPDIA